MKRFLGIFAVLMCVPFAARADVDLTTDTSDPLFILRDDAILSETGLSYGHDILRLGQGLSYGLNDRLSVSGRVHYQFDFADDADGFSSIDLGGTYRLARAGDNNAHLVSDVIVGFRFGGSKHVRTPWFADSSYYAGLRFGRQWAGVTLAATIKSTWVFDNDRGMSYIDFIPESYFRIDSIWRAGGGFTFRKSTNPHYNQEWLNLRGVAQFGRTQYIGHFDYEFEHEEAQIGAKVNILF
jgi:hypothetical protein